LLRLIRRGGRCHEFRPGRLCGAGAFVLPADTPEGVRRRDDLHNQVAADLFIPAGGRPETINERNWRRFLDAEGRPTARAMVEAANIFISDEARRRLERRGLLVAPGSSANKTGVICSSYEILAGLVLSESEFLAIKDEFVRELLVILRARARAEARLLLRERALAGGTRPLTELSFELSRAINALADRIFEVLAAEVPDPAADPVLARALLAYCPASLARPYGERLLRDVPRPHQLALLAKHISARMHYHEGLDWAERLLRSRPAGAVVRAYLEGSERVDELLRGLARSRLAGRGELERIVRAAGRRRLALDRLGFDQARRSRS
ncbi:MAG: amino acid dehydrogenase, partial [Desulfovibrionaceae bacterium]